MNQLLPNLVFCILAKLHQSDFNLKKLDGTIHSFIAATILLLRGHYPSYSPNRRSDFIWMEGRKKERKKEPIIYSCSIFLVLNAL